MRRRRSRRQSHIEFVEQAIEVAAGEPPLEGLGDSLVVALEGDQASTPRDAPRASSDELQVAL
jgi:hypothetical protein